MIFARCHAQLNLKSFAKWRSCSALILSRLMLVTGVVDADVVVIKLNCFNHTDNVASLNGDTCLVNNKIARQFYLLHHANRYGSV